MGNKICDKDHYTHPTLIIPSESIKLQHILVEQQELDLQGKINTYLFQPNEAPKMGKHEPQDIHWIEVHNNHLNIKTAFLSRATAFFAKFTNSKRPKLSKQASCPKLGEVDIELLTESMLERRKQVRKERKSKMLPKRYATYLKNIEESKSPINRNLFKDFADQFQNKPPKKSFFGAPNNNTSDISSGYSSITPRSPDSVENSAGTGESSLRRKSGQRNSLKVKGISKHGLGNLGMGKQRDIGIQNFIMEEKKESVWKTYTPLKEIYHSVNVIYIVKHKQSGEIRTLKKIPKDSYSKTENPEIEFSILRSLDHPNIMRVYEHFQDSYFYYLITEYCSGGSLFEKLHEMKHFSEPLTAKILEQLLAGVAYIHSLRIVHRDLKLENILFSSKSIYSAVKIIDFGCAKIKEDGILKSLAGTPYYIAPEVIRGGYSEKCDIWSIGVVAFMLLTCTPPFDGKNDQDIFKSILQNDIHYSRLIKRVSQECVNLIKTLLTYKHVNRRSALEALKHDFFLSKVNPFQSRQLAAQAKLALNNLMTFHANYPLQRATLAYLASRLGNNAEEHRIKKVFEYLDKDKDGVINMCELKLILNQHTQFIGSPTISAAENIMFRVDVNSNGKIEYNEFLMANMSLNNILTEDNLWDVFTVFADKTGFITPKNMQNIFKEDVNASYLTPYSWDSREEDTPSPCKYKVDYEEFKQIMFLLKNPQTPIPPKGHNQKGKENSSFSQIANDKINLRPGNISA